MVNGESPEEPAPLCAEEEDFLRALARVVIYIPRAFEADLGREHGFTTSEYFTLMHLSDAPGNRLRMGDIAGRTALSPGAVTRVVKLLESKGLVQRQPSTIDGRGSDAVLTARGIERLAQVRPTQVESVRRRVFDKFEGVDLKACTDALDRIGQDD